MKKKEKRKKERGKEKDERDEDKNEGRRFPPVFFLLDSSNFPPLAVVYLQSGI